MIELYGWNDRLQTAFAAYAARGLVPARAIAQHRSHWQLVTPDGEATGTLSGRLAFEAAPGDLPVVGDFLAISRSPGDTDAVIQSVLPRSTVFSRREAGGQGVQVIAANVDVAFLVAALNADLNPRRLERYLVAVRDSGAVPVVVLTKADLSPDPDAARDSIVAIAGGAAVVAISAIDGHGLDGLKRWLKPGTTAVLLGSSGAGKSTLLNALAEKPLMDTGAVRAADDRGRHTTRHRELFRLASGALLIDTPGMRELGLLTGDGALDESFDDVVALIASCRFASCRHDHEPGCAIRGAIADRSLSDERWNGYLKLQRELSVAHHRDAAATPPNRRAGKTRHAKVSRARLKHLSRSDED